MKSKKKYIIAIIAVFLLILIVMGFLWLKNAFYPNESTVIYGNRLDGRSKVEIKEETKKQIQEKVAEQTTKCTVRIAGRIINITMTMKDGISRDDAKNISNSILENFSDEEKGYYDIQFLISHETNNQEFPIIGYKHHTKPSINWTKDRTAG